ncbi:class I SAM-dependent methyltransferase [Aestuariibius sp. 2305UL40-4]|uniref:class I SAM-dependent methyltransferase n=1 Tax=Aestuariibius violaceus TaxID=3234132 RepID=UPI00398EF252
MGETDWDRSAAAWIADMAGGGDSSRVDVLDPVMVALAEGSGASEMLDVGCGEGRFCRMMAARGLRCVGVDPTAALLAEARRLDPGGTYLDGRAEALPVEDGAFGLVVSYLSLIDIPGMEAAVAEMARALRPGGQCLIANLQSFSTASQIKGSGWQRQEDGSVRMTMSRYLEEHTHKAAWRGVEIENWHRPLSAYMQAFLCAGLRLVRFEEPPAIRPERAVRYNEAPYFLVMLWEKPV